MEDLVNSKSEIDLFRKILREYFTKFKYQSVNYLDFKNLMFVCIDEQHKFGVKQRAVFKKFNSPHILQMTATPIPRSMALAFFGEFDVSIIDQLPE